MKHPIVISSSGEFVNKWLWQGVLKNFSSINAPTLKAKLAQALIIPLRRNLDYQGIARRALVVTPLDEKK